ncbi:DUF2330 domain-containing protein [Candidatus Woesebacteria bacterium]|nr:DUF2330 domain-containing protein [Candidatus Woesebacteria bacterium]
MSNRDFQVVQTESKAAIIFDGEKETILDGLTFDLNPTVIWNFVWLIPVPTKPEVELVKDDLFPKLENISKGNFAKNNIFKRILYFDIEEQNSFSGDLYTRPASFLRFEVISPPNQIDKLNNWLSYSGYLIPKGGRKLLREYEQKGWYFVIAEIDALHMMMDPNDILSLPGAHTFPIKITFPTDRIIYPLKLASIQPDYDSENITLSITYGLKSQDILGEKDERIDDELSEQSKNKYPSVPLDYAHLKVELFVFSDEKVYANGLNTIYADNVNREKIEFKDFKGQTYQELPKNKMFLTRLVTFKPMVQLEDLYVEESRDVKRINPDVSKKELFLRILFFVTISLFITNIITRRLRQRTVETPALRQK